jgi:hypothetical protein
MQLNTDLFERYDAMKYKMELLTDYCYPAIGGVSAYFHFDSEANECWLYLDVCDGSTASSDTFIAIVPLGFVNKVQDIDFDPYNDADYSRRVIKLAESALSQATHHQTDNQKKSQTGGRNLRLS